MLIYVDIDETICESPKDRDYTKAQPIKERIEKINKLFDEGNTIVYWTARGTMTGIDWYQVTQNMHTLLQHILQMLVQTLQLFLHEECCQVR